MATESPVQFTAERHYRQVLNRIADQTGHPPLAPGELHAESIAERVEALSRHLEAIEERLESLSPGYLEQVSASLEHHEEHHQREEELQGENARLRAALQTIQQTAAEAIRCGGDEDGGGLYRQIEADARTTLGMPGEVEI